MRNAYREASYFVLFANIIMVIKSRWAGHGADEIEIKRSPKTSSKNINRRLRRRQENNIKEYLEEIVCEGVDRIQ
jgi:hypothetical protein